MIEVTDLAAESEAMHKSIAALIQEINDAVLAPRGAPLTPETQEWKREIVSQYCALIALSLILGDVLPMTLKILALKQASVIADAHRKEHGCPTSNP